MQAKLRPVNRTSRIWCDANAGRLSGLVIQAFKALGREHLTQQRVDHLKRTLPLEKRRTLLDDLGFAPAWIRPILLEIAEVND
ncbi:MAG: hypothetical protein ACK48K_22460 [Planctomycetota bacterium]